MRSRDSAPLTDSSGRFARLLAEAGWIVGAVAAVALLATLATFSSNDPAFTHSAGSAAIENVGGTLQHASGTTVVDADVQHPSNPARAKAVHGAVYRTARRLFEGSVLYQPRAAAARLASAAE